MRTATCSWLGEMLNERELTVKHVYYFLQDQEHEISLSMTYNYILAATPTYRDRKIWILIFDLIEAAGVCWHGEVTPTEEQEKLIRAAKKRTKAERIKIRADSLRPLCIPDYKLLKTRKTCIK